MTSQPGGIMTPAAPRKDGDDIGPALPPAFEHALMNLLAVIGGHADLIAMQTTKEPRLHKGAQAIRSACAKAVALTREWPETREAALKKAG